MCHPDRPRSSEKIVLAALLLSELRVHKLASTQSARGMEHDQQRQSPQSFQPALTYTGYGICF